MAKKVCCTCGGPFGLIRYRSWLKTYCSRDCKRIEEHRLAKETKRRKALLKEVSNERPAT